MLLLFEFLGCLFAPVAIAFSVAVFVFWLWILVEVVTKEPTEGNTQLIWVLIVVFLHALGALLYLLIRRDDRIREVGA